MPEPTPNFINNFPRVGVGVKVARKAALLLLLFALLSPAAAEPPVRRRVRGTGRSPNPAKPTASAFLQTDTTFNLEESKRLLRLESAHPNSYLYRYRAHKTSAPTPLPSPTPPVISPAFSTPRTRRRTTVSPQKEASASPSPQVPVAVADSALKPESKKSDENAESDSQPQSPMPYYYYLDYDGNGKVKLAKDLSPQPSENIKASSLADQQGQLWTQYLIQLQLQTETLPTTTTPATPLAYLNEIDYDNYTIPSLKNYKFPDFKTVSTTPSPLSPNFLNPYEFYSEEDLENVADLDLAGDHSKYFVKTKPRDVSSSTSNLYNSFYYEPPSYTTKIHPLPVKAKFPSSLTLTKEKEKEKERLRLKWEWKGGAGTGSNGNSNSYSYFEELVTLPMSTATATTTTTPIPIPIPTTEKPVSTNFSEYLYEYLIPEDNQDVAAAESVYTLKGEKFKDSLNVNLIPEGYYYGRGNNKAFSYSFSEVPAQNHEQQFAFSHSPSTTSTPIPTTISTTSSPLPAMAFTTTTPSSTSNEGEQDTTNIPGMPGIDYPIFDEVPITRFNCTEQRYKGFFADIETKCQVWHYCDFADGQSSFICPNGTLFSQVLLTCDWWFNVDCEHAQQLYVLNERLYRYIKPPKPSFPEDYHGPQVDLWLKKQLELGLLPKIKKRGKNGNAQKPRPVPTTLREKVEENSTTTASPTDVNVTSIPNEMPMIPVTETKEYTMQRK